MKSLVAALLFIATVTYAGVPSSLSPPVTWNPSCASGIQNLFTNSCLISGSGGSVSSVGFSDGSSTAIFNISGSPVISTGTLTEVLIPQSAHTFLGGATSGTLQPGFRLLSSSDIPSLSYVSSIGVTAPIATTGGLTPTLSCIAATGSVAGCLSAADWTTFNGKQASGNYITALTSDVSASGPGSASATVNSVGGSSASNIHSAELAANAATNANTASTIVKRDSSGNFSAGTITASLTGHSSLDLALTGGTMSGAINMGSSKITSLLDPTLAQDAATKTYVDSQLSQLNPAAAVYASSTANIAGTYTNAVSGVCIGDIFTTTSTATFTTDGVTPPLNSRILFKDQSSSFQGGVWTITTAAVPAVSGTVFTRALDMDSSADLNAGQIIPIANGTTLAGASYYQSATNTTCNTSSQTWTLFQRASSAYALSSRLINTTAPITGGGDLSADRTFACNVASGSQPGCLASADWTTFNSKQATVSIGSFNNSSTANGLDITSNAIALHAADGTNPGAVTTGTQTIAGAKTFTSTVSGLTGGQLVQYFGQGNDGNVIVSGAVTLARDMYYNNLTISAGSAINTAGYRIFVAGTLDLTGCPAGGIARNGVSGTAGSGASSGANATALATGSLGGSGTQASPTAGSANSASSPAANATTTAWGMVGGTSGSGGNGSTGTGGTGTANTVTNLFPINRWTPDLTRGAALVLGGIAGGAGAGGGGDTSNSGGGGGGTSTGAGIVWIAANTISRGGSTAAGCVQAIGATGANGGNGAAAGNTGGGGSSGGGSGGVIFIAYGSLTGSTGTNAVDASGGAGGNGGNGFGASGHGGGGGGAGAGGQIDLFNLSTGTNSVNSGPGSVAGGAASGVTGGTGASINTYQVSL